MDIKEKKMTLPLIYLLNNASSSEKRKIIGIVKRKNDNAEQVAWLINRINDSGGIDYAHKMMEEFKARSIELLNDFPDNSSRTALISLIEYSTARNK